MKRLIFKIGGLFTLIGLFTSCNNAPKEEPQPIAKDTVQMMKADTTPKAPEFKPFDVVQINHAVKEFDSWKKAFDADSVNRKASGLDFIVIGREIGKPNNLTIYLQALDVQKAKEFAGSPRLKEVMAKNGVLSKPLINYLHVIRFNQDSKEKQWVVVTHRVKDFDAWLKVFDSEGPANRASQGLIDVVLARGIDDPNLVQLVFDIKDQAKAKASIFSEEKKKLMESAGVEGKPTIAFYNSAE